MADENLSGVPPSVTLSGLNAGAPSIGGTAQPGLSGAPGQGGAGAGFLPGMEGGMDLATLLQMLQAQGGDTTGVGSAGDISQSLGANSFGSQQGGLGAGSFGQTQPGYVAGMSNNGSQGSVGANADPASIIQKFLGVAQQGAGLLGGAGTASPTSGDVGVSLSDQLRSASDPFASSYANATGAPSPGVTGGPMPTQAGDVSAPTDMQINSLGIPMGDINPQVIDALFQAGLTGDQIKALVGGSGMESGGLEQMLSGSQGGAGGLTSSTGIASPTAPNGTDYLGGGLGLLSGLMNLYQGGKSGNAGSILGGAGGTLAGANQLLPGMGLGEAGSSLGLVGGAANAPFAALSLANAIDQGDAGGIAQGLASLYGTTVPTINAIFGTSLPTLTSIAGSALTSLGGTIGGSIGGSLGSLGASLGGGAAAGAGTGAASGAAAGAAGAGAALPLAMVTGPYVLAKLIQAWQAMGPDKANARQLANRVENIYGQLPGELSKLQGIPGITGQLNAGSSPEQAADILKQLNTLQDQYQTGGWESYQKQGGTGVRSVGEGTMGASLPDVQKALNAMDPQMAQMDIARLRAQDMLSKAGWTPEQIQAQTGRYIGPQEWAMNLNSQKYLNAAPQYGNFNPTFNEQFRPGSEEANLAMPVEQWSGSRYAASPQGLLPGMGYNGMLGTPFGAVPREMWDQLAGIAPGNLEQGLMQYLQPYGGVNPLYAQMGFGQGLSPAMMQQTGGGVPPHIMAAANSPNASTAGGAPMQGNADGRLTEETLMDLLRRMSPGAAYQGATR